MWIADGSSKGGGDWIGMMRPLVCFMPSIDQPSQRPRAAQATPKPDQSQPRISVQEKEAECMHVEETAARGPLSPSSPRLLPLLDSVQQTERPLFDRSMDRCAHQLADRPAACSSSSSSQWQEQSAPLLLERPRMASRDSCCSRCSTLETIRRAHTDHSNPKHG